MNLHQLLQEKIGTSVPKAEELIDAARQAGALGAKISGSGGGGIIIALVEPEQANAVAQAIDAVGGRSYMETNPDRVAMRPTNAEGCRVAWALLEQL